MKVHDLNALKTTTEELTVGNDTITDFDSLITSKNNIINGDFNLWYRGASFSSVANNKYTTDRFIYGYNGLMRHNISRSTDVPTFSESDHKSNYSVLIDCVTADTSIATTEYTLFEQRIEGYNIQNIVGRTCTLSFWVKATITGTYCISFRASLGSTVSYIVEYTVDSSNTWEKKTITLDIDTTIGSNWDYTNGIGLMIAWILACGFTYQTTSDIWYSGNKLATSNQVNSCASTANNFYLSQVQFEVGASATSFDDRKIQTEIELCQRYYEVGSVHNYRASPYFNSTSSFHRNVIIPYLIEKRAIPTVTYTTQFLKNINTQISTKLFHCYGQSFTATDSSVVNALWTSEAEL